MRRSVGLVLGLVAGCTLSFDASRLEDVDPCEPLEPRTKRTLYVAMDGSDDADGSEESPFATLQKAADVVEPGDLVIARDGSYVGFEVSRSGSADAPIVFRGDGAKIDRPNPDDSGILLRSTAHVWIEGFRIDSAGEPFADAGIRQKDGPIEGVVVRDNAVVGAERGVALGSAPGALVTRNTVRDIGCFGISIGNSDSDGATIRDNVVQNAGKFGIFVEGSATPGADTLLTDITIENNKVRGADAAIALDSVHDSVVRNNLLHELEGDGIRVYAIGGAAPSSGLTVVNNTVHGPPDATGACMRVQQHGDDNVVFDNVFVHEGGAAVLVWSTDGLSFDFNALGGGLVLQEGGAPVGLSGWRDAGFGASSFAATPGELFVDAATARYELRDGAPAIDAGTTSFEGREAPDRDLAGVRRPAGGGVDLGAFEKGGEPACP